MVTNDTGPGIKQFIVDARRHTGVSLGSSDLLVEAVTHPSYVHEHPGTGGDNQRLEFLGDAVLNLVVTHEIFDRNSDLSEGAMSRARALVVCDRNLARVADRLGMGRLLRLGRGEEAGGGRTRPSVLADAFEAVVGAVFLDQGLEGARLFTLAVLGPELHEVVRSEPPADPKSALQQLAQQSPGIRLTYVVEQEDGPDHDKRFVVSARLNGREVGRGRGRSKREAERVAAMRALARRTSEAADCVKHPSDDTGLNGG